MPHGTGRFCLILHGHLPYVLHHGIAPHGEAWLYEAAAETYLPLLSVLDELKQTNHNVAITLGMTPVLLLQLVSSRFKTGFVEFLNERMNRASLDREQFERDRLPIYVQLATRWQAFYADKLTQFKRLSADIPAAFVEHIRGARVELLTGPMTHGYLPLLMHERTLAAQLRAGFDTTLRLTGIRPTGIWLPECAYRPADSHWEPPVLCGESIDRPGLEQHLAELGLDHFFVSTQLIESAEPAGTFIDGKFASTHEALTYWDSRRGWKSTLEPVGVVSEPGMARVFAFGRHPRVSEQVWSGEIGYPGSSEYLDFHSTHGPGGLRYRQVTDHHSSSDAKYPYDPVQIPAKIAEHAEHFCQIVKQTLAEYTQATGRVGTVVAPFDAELFGHWWFEGPQFLSAMLTAMSAEVDVVTSQQALADNPRDKIVHLPEGSWGEGGRHLVWLNEQTRWLWECQYRAETRYLELLDALPWQNRLEVQKMLGLAARELFLLQSSDWPFIIHGQAAADYGITRFANHYERFNRLATLAERLSAGQTLTTVEKSELVEANAHDKALGPVDLRWFL